MDNHQTSMKLRGPLFFYSYEPGRLGTMLSGGGACSPAGEHDSQPMRRQPQSERPQALNVPGGLNSLFPAHPTQERRTNKMNFTLQPWNQSHIPAIAKYANNEKIAGRLKDSFPYPYTEKDAAGFVAHCMEQEGRTQISRAVVVDGEAAGCVTIVFGQDVFSRSAELGYWLGEPFWRKGIMTEAVQKLCEEAFLKYKLIRISAEPFATNLASRGVLEKAGFQLEGIKRKSIFKNGCIQDSHLYAVIHV